MPKTQVAAQVLLYLATDGPVNKWQIAKGLGKAYSNIHEVVRRLSNEGLIYVAKKEAAEKNYNMEVEYYDLTFSGLVAVLLDKRAWLHIDTIAKKYSGQLPLIFGKWDFYKRQGIQEEVITRLKGAVLQTLENWEKIMKFTEIKGQPLAKQRLQEFRNLFELDAKVRGLNAEKEMEKLATAVDVLEQALLAQVDVPREITNIVIFGLPKWRIQVEEQATFLLKIKEDPELNKYILQQLDELKGDYMRTLQNIEAWRLYLA